MGSLEKGRDSALNAAGSRKGTLLGWAMGLLPFRKPVEAPVSKGTADVAEAAPVDTPTLVRVTVSKGLRSAVQTVHGERLAVADERAARLLAEQHFSERRRSLEDKGKVLTKLDVEVRCVDGECQFVAEHDAYVAKAAKAAKGAKDAKDVTKVKAA